MRQRITTRLMDEAGLIAALQTIRSNSPGSAESVHAQAYVSVEMAVWQMNMAEQSARSLNRATWALAFSTAGLVLATAVLIVVTATHG